MKQQILQSLLLIVSKRYVTTLLSWMICYNFMNIVCLPCFVFVYVGLCFARLPFFYRLALFLLRKEKSRFGHKTEIQSNLS